MKKSKKYSTHFHPDLLAFIPAEREGSFILHGDKYYKSWHKPFCHLKYSLERYGMNYDLLIQQQREHLNRFPELRTQKKEKMYKPSITFSLGEQMYIFTPTEGRRSSQSIWFRADRVFRTLKYYYSSRLNMSLYEMRHPNMEKQDKIILENREKDYRVGSLIIFDNGMKIATPTANATLSDRNEKARLYLAYQAERELFIQ